MSRSKVHQPNTDGDSASTSSSAMIDLKEEETEFFGITPVSYVDTVVNHINDFIFDCVDIMEKKLVKEGLFTHQEAQESLDNFLATAQASVDRQFDLFELYVLKNIFVVRPEWNGPENGKCDVNDDDKASDEALASLKGQIESAMAFHESLLEEQAELRRLSSVVRQVEEFKTEFQKLEKQAQMESWPLLAESVSQLICDAARMRKLMPPKTSSNNSSKNISRVLASSQHENQGGRSAAMNMDMEAAAQFEAILKAT